MYSCSVYDVLEKKSGHSHPSVVMPPTLKKFEGHIAFGSFVRLSVCAFIELLRFLVHSITFDTCMLGF